jgi:hypothetical protein
MMPRVREPRALQLNFSILRLNFRVPLGCGHPSFARDDQIPATEESDVIASSANPSRPTHRRSPRLSRLYEAAGCAKRRFTIPIHS